MITDEQMRGYLRRREKWRDETFTIVHDKSTEKRGDREGRSINDIDWEIKFFRRRVQNLDLNDEIRLKYLDHIALMCEFKFQLGGGRS